MTTKNTLDTAIAKRMVEAQAIRGASIIGQPGGWSVMLKFGVTEKPLGAQRTDKPRIWRSLDRCVDYLKSELHIARFDTLDATYYSDVPIAGNARNDCAERMRAAHEAAAYDKWLKAEIQEAIEDPRPSIPHEEVKRHFAARRNALLKRIATEKT
ncbi:MAG: hypothetical protein GZ090_09310 [Oxalobacteraceae bacterium]|nr:hypothetical protein [Oxalobacteraceae bacterium]